VPIPDVIITQLDGALGILPPSAGKMLAFVGVASLGAIATPAAFSRASDIQANFGEGITVEAACYAIERYGKPVIFVRSATSTPGAAGVLVDDGVLGTSVITNDVSSAPLDDYEAGVLIVGGGTKGTAGITYQWTLDGGRTYSPITALGIAGTITIPNSGVVFAIGAGTLLAGDTWSTRTTAPISDAAAVAAALTALGAALLPWEFAYVTAPILPTTLAAIDTAASSLAAAGKFRWFVGNTRMPNEGETEAAYKTSLDGLFGDLSCKSLSLYAGAAKTVSSVSYRNYRRPIAFSVAPRQSSVSEEINLAEVDLGPLPGVTIRDSNGNPDEHDEAINPGLDDSRFGTARTWDGVEGVYITWPRIFAPTGSDFQIAPYRRVMNLFCETVRLYMLHRIAKPIRVDKATGFILEADALEIEAGALAQLRTVLMKKPKASDVQFVLSRTDNLISTQTLTGDGRLVPLAYPKFIEIVLGFNNPALRVVAV